jgi:hypothetical protein
VGRRRGRLRLRRELVHVVLLAAAASPEREELRLKAVVVVVVGLAGVAHGREKGILGGQAPLPHGRRRRRLQVLELEDGDLRLVLHLLVELEQAVVAVLLLLLLLLLICFLLRSSTSSSSAAAASVVVAVRNPVVVPRIQIPRLVARRYCCSDSDNARPSTSPVPITRTARNTEKKGSQKRAEDGGGGGGGMGRERERERSRREVVARDGH